MPGLLSVVGLLSIVACLADAAELRIEALTLPYASPWQRATPQQESEDDTLLLDAPDAGLHLAVPRQTRLLKLDADAYYAKLRENWQKLYGNEAKISWLESGGVPVKQKWLLCRRPSRDNGVGVFHLSTVVEGRAYSVLLFAPAGAETLPTMALDLLAGIRIGAGAAQGAVQPAWVKTRTLYPKAHADLLEALVQSDVARLGDDGMVTGYGLDFGESSVDWFIEGYQWKTVDAQVARVAWKQGGRLQVKTNASVSTMQLTLKENEADVRASLRVIELCAPAQRITDALELLQRGAFAQFQRLAQERAPGCPDLISLAAPANLQGESRKTVQADVALTLPPAPGPAELAEIRKAGLTRIVLVEIALKASSARTGFGDGLIERARWYVVFEMGGSGARAIRNGGPGIGVQKVMFVADVVTTLSRLGKAQRAQHCMLGGWAVGHTSFCPTYNC